MAAPKGNKFWELRSKHGRDKLFGTPELLWEAACEYFIWCEKHPFYEVEQTKSQSKPVYDAKKEKIVYPPATIRLPKMRPFTMQGLCSYLDCHTKYFYDFERNLPTDDKDFSHIITRIKEAIYNQKFSGAAAGFLNANIIARDLGLRDTQNINVNKIGADLADEQYTTD